jgi:hypothetical protein
MRAPTEDDDVMPLPHDVVTYILSYYVADTGNLPLDEHSEATMSASAKLFYGRFVDSPEPQLLFKSVTVSNSESCTLLPRGITSIETSFDGASRRELSNLLPRLQDLTSLHVGTLSYTVFKRKKGSFMYDTTPNVSLLSKATNLKSLSLDDGYQGQVILPKFRSRRARREEFDHRSALKRGFELALAQVPKLAHLEHLHITSRGLSEASAKAIHECVNLKSLTLDLYALNHNKDILNLDLLPIHRLKLARFPFLKFEMPTTVYSYGMAISEKKLDHLISLQSCTNLRTLEMDGNVDGGPSCVLSTKIVNEILKIPGLRALVLTRMDLKQKQALKLLANSGTIKSLTIYNCLQASDANLTLASIANGKLEELILEEDLPTNEEAFAENEHGERRSSRNLGKRKVEIEQDDVPAPKRRNTRKK